MRERMLTVIRFGAGSCSFNTQGQCYARGIRIEGPTGDCDTYHASDSEMEEQVGSGAVAACKA